MFSSRVQILLGLIAVFVNHLASGEMTGGVGGRGWQAGRQDS